MGLELKIYAPTEDAFVEHITWNADEIAKEVAAKVGYYKTLVYTEDQVAEAKKDRAQLNKFITALKDKDAEIKRRCLAPYEELHAQMLKIISLVDEPVKLIDSQVKGFEEKQRTEKAREINALFQKKGFPEWVTVERIWNPRWLNKTFLMKNVDAELTFIKQNIETDSHAINSMSEGGQAALAEYKRTLNISDAIAAANRFVEAKRAEDAKAATAEAARIEEQARQIMDEQPFGEVMPEPVPTPAIHPAPVVDQPAEPVRKEIMFKVLVTFEEMQALNNFLIENKIRFQQINKAQALA